MKPLISVILFLFHSYASYSQKYIDVTDETLTVNSRTALLGNTRNITSITLPEKSIGYIYRVSVFPKGNADAANSLFKLIRSVDPSTALATTLMQFSIKNNDGNSVDAFIFNNTYDADNFYAKNDNNWSACKSMPNRSNCCFSTNDCINRTIYFGFRNNNISQGLDVKLEVVAIVDSSKLSNYSFSYTVQNGTDREIKIQISNDDLNWAEKSLRSGYQETYTLEQSKMYIRIYTTTDSFVHYKLDPAERYKIIFNQQDGKWDIIHF